MTTCACGRRFLAAERFCAQCGRPVEAASWWFTAPATPADLAPPRPTPRPRHRLAGAVIAVVGLTMLTALCFGVAVRSTGVGDAEIARHLPRIAVAATATPTPMPLERVGALALSRVVTVEALTDDGERLGTGWLLDGSGDFVTNAHVVAGQRGLRLLDRAGSLHPAVLMGSDAGQDVAVVRAADGFRAAPLPVTAAAGDAVPVDVVVLASGRATGHGDVTLERLVARHRTVTIQPEEEGLKGGAPIVEDDMLLLSGHLVYQGNSGGPVLDAGGHVIGIVTAASTSQPHAFAIPLERVLAELMALARGPGG